MVTARQHNAAQGVIVDDYHFAPATPPSARTKDSMKPAKVYAAILPSGRAVKFRTITTSAMLDISDRHGGATAKISKAVVESCLVAITRGPVPVVTKETPAGTEPDYEAMAASVDLGAGGGWVPLSEQIMATATSGLTFADLFDEYFGDYKALNGLIGEVSSLGKGQGELLASKPLSLSAP